ncbi:FtsQ-type POTRA domain-containing protein [Heliorestis acidaminivorans]|uniref:FtsQ-type POTRA domain-containing protein n=1 Tax=Heliorestis acidaminivorans TaxID=553427 RepID=A0A6I0F438_9FIRM|nr:FtsQ-type POTRA domain-containing protein [Heliorestis acidaminivorans]KAB2954520.1 FtsQ-type POTRA domain-containing protein [Heliorestis acidaminivorans]
MVRRRANVLAFFFLSLLVLSIYYFMHSPYFAVSKITVTGLTLLEEEDLIRLSGIRNGENLWRLNSNRVREQLTFHPQVKDVEVLRSWPSEVQLKVEERKPTAVLVEGSYFILLDQEATYLRSLQSLQGFPLPVITGVEVPAQVGPGQTIHSKALKQALDLCYQLDSALLLRIGEVHVGVESRIVLYTSEGIEIRFGVVERISEKEALLKEILNELAMSGELKKVRYIDLSSPKAPAIKPKDGVALQGIKSMGVTIGEGIYD